MLWQYASIFVDSLWYLNRRKCTVYLSPETANLILFCQICFDLGSAHGRLNFWIIVFQRITITDILTKFIHRTEPKNFFRPIEDYKTKKSVHDVCLQKALLLKTLFKMTSTSTCKLRKAFITIISAGTKFISILRSEMFLGVVKLS